MRRRLLAVLVAAVLAAAGCLAVVTYVRGVDRRTLAGQEAVWVLVATQRIPAGTTGAKIQAGGYTRRIAMPAATVPADGVEAIDDQLAALSITADVQPSQLLLRGMFGESTRISGGLALPEGKVAVSVETTAASRVAGFVRPGSKVAIFDTFTVRDGKGRVPSGARLSDNYEYNHATRVLLPRIEVLAVGERGTAGAAISTPSAEGQPAKDTAKAGQTVLVTVAAGQDEAEKLIHASLTGTLTLVLLDDTATIAPGAGVDNNSLFP
ncbi:Flp pilus assembly protein CpaB [Actinoplanes sp. NPDC049599]|uniref:Flp pilus assembly protein CpaB n=1 Tax=Actinoplanes sp. NPDC049599 TaxID=3363903 RepID=UPI0037BD86AD